MLVSKYYTGVVLVIGLALVFSFHSVRADRGPAFASRLRPVATSQDYTIARGLSVAYIGDSLMKDFALSSPVDILWKGNVSAFGNGIIDDSSSLNSPMSLFKLLSREGPVRIEEFARPGATVNDSQVSVANQFALWMKDFHRQTTSLLSMTPLPQLTAIWIGHNDLDWAYNQPEAALKSPGDRLASIREKFRLKYEAELNRLAQLMTVESRKNGRRFSIVVFGLIHSADTFIAHSAAREKHRQDAKLYPYIEQVVEERFPSLKPEYAPTMVALQEMLDADLKAMVENLQSQILTPDVHIRYSPALSEVDLKDPAILNTDDGFHLSAFGQSIIAREIFRAIQPELNFLGWPGDLKTKNIPN